MQKFKLASKSGNLNVHVFNRIGASKTILCLHGGPLGDHRGNSNVFEEIREYAIRDDFCVCQFDFFGSGESDGSQRDFDLATMLNDYAAVSEFVRTRCPLPLVVIGESMGATIAAMNWLPNVTKYVLLWPAFDLVDTDLRPFLTKEMLQQAQQEGYLTPDGMEMGFSFLKQIAERDFTGCYVLPSQPCLLVHGKKDKAVPFKQSILAAEKALGKVALYLHPTGDHGLQLPQERKYLHEIVRSWLVS